MAKSETNQEPISKYNSAFELLSYYKHIASVNSFETDNFANKSKKDIFLKIQIKSNHYLLNISEIYQIDSFTNKDFEYKKNSYLVGIHHIHGNLFPIIDLNYYLYKAEDIFDYNKIIILKIEKNFIGIVVNSCKGIIRYSFDERKSMQSLKEKEKEIFHSRYRHHGKDIHSINLKKLISIIKKENRNESKVKNKFF